MTELAGRGSTFVVDTGPPASGRDDAPTLILLHALACTGLLSWYPSLAALSARYRVIAFDQRWHGRGIRSPHFALDDLADDTVAVADALGVERFVPVGYSMGALVAQLVARRHRDRVDGLVLGASTMRFRRGEVEPLALRLLAYRIGLIAERKLRGGPFGAPLADVSDANRWALGQFRSTSKSEILGATAVLARFDSTSWAHQLNAPAAVVITLRDHAIPVGASARTRSQPPRRDSVRDRRQVTPPLCSTPSGSRPRCSLLALRCRRVAMLSGGLEQLCQLEAQVVGQRPQVRRKLAGGDQADVDMAVVGQDGDVQPRTVEHRAEREEADDARAGEVDRHRRSRNVRDHQVVHDRMAIGEPQPVEYTRTAMPNVFGAANCAQSCSSDADSV